MIHNGTFKAMAMIALMSLVQISIGQCADKEYQVASDEQKTWQLSANLEISTLLPGVWIHTSWYTFESGSRFASNGLIVQEADGVVLIDTAWGEAPVNVIREQKWWSRAMVKRVGWNCCYTPLNYLHNPNEPRCGRLNAAQHGYDHRRPGKPHQITI
jgi:hypothetical protein